MGNRRVDRCLALLLGHAPAYALRKKPVSKRGALLLAARRRLGLPLTAGQKIIGERLALLVSATTSLTQIKNTVGTPCTVGNSDLRAERPAEGHAANSDTNVRTKHDLLLPSKPKPGDVDVVADAAAPGRRRHP